MVNFQLNLAALMGLVSVAFAVLLPVFALSRQPSDSSRVLQGFALAPFYFFAGVILIFFAWRFDPIMQFSQLFLIGLNAYWIVKDSSR